MDSVSSIVRNLPVRLPQRNPSFSQAHSGESMLATDDTFIRQRQMQGGYTSSPYQGSINGGSSFYSSSAYNRETQRLNEIKANINEKEYQLRVLEDKLRMASQDNIDLLYNRARELKDEVNALNKEKNELKEEVNSWYRERDRVKHNYDLELDAVVQQRRETERLKQLADAYQEELLQPQLVELRDAFKEKKEQLMKQLLEDHDRSMAAEARAIREVEIREEARREEFEKQERYHIHVIEKVKKAIEEDYYEDTKELREQKEKGIALYNKERLQLEDNHSKTIATMRQTHERNVKHLEETFKEQLRKLEATENTRVSKATTKIKRKAEAEIDRIKRETEEILSKCREDNAKAVEDISNAILMLVDKALENNDKLKAYRAQEEFTPVCAVCLGENPHVRFKCGHLLCTECTKTVTRYGKSKCVHCRSETLEKDLQRVYFS